MNLAIEIEAALDRLIHQHTLLEGLPDQSLESVSLSKIYEGTKAHLLFLSEQASTTRNLFSSTRKARCVQKISCLEKEDLSSLKKILSKKEFHIRRRRLENNKVSV